jgi:hypothetical protein
MVNLIAGLMIGFILGAFLGPNLKKHRRDR